MNCSIYCMFKGRKPHLPRRDFLGLRVPCRAARCVEVRAVGAIAAGYCGEMHKCAKFRDSPQCPRSEILGEKQNLHLLATKT